MSHNLKATSSSPEFEEPLLPPPKKERVEEDHLDCSDDIEARLETGWARSFHASAEAVVRFGIVPFVLVLMANAVPYSMIMNRPRYGGRDPLSAFQSNAQVTAVVLLADAVFFYKALGWLQMEQKKLEEEEEQQEEEQEEASSSEEGGTCAGLKKEEAQQPAGAKTCAIPKHPDARLSRKLDEFLHGSSAIPPKVPTLVGLLYALMVTCAAGSLASLGVRMYAATPAAAADCFGNNHLEDYVPDYSMEAIPEAVPENKKIEGLPDGLQTWAVGLLKQKEIPDRWSNADNMEKPGSYVHTKDGRTFFQGEPRGKSQQRRSMLFGTSPDGSLKKYENILNPGHFVAVQGSEEEDTVETFCCLYNTPYPETPFGFYRKRLLCYSANRNEFRNTSVPGENIERFVTLKAFEGALWYATLWQSYNHPLREEKRLSTFHQLDSKSMRWKSMANGTVHIPPQYHETVISQFGRDRGNNCVSWVSTISSLLAGMVVVPAAFWLLRGKQVAAGVAPVSLLGCYMVQAASEEYLYPLTFLMPLLSTILIIRQFPKWMDRETLIWAHYSLGPYLIVLSFRHDAVGMMAMINVGWVIFLGAIMNHRTFAIAGYCFGFFFIVLPLPFHAPEALLSLPLGIIMVCGMITVDRQVQKYHSYIVFKVKRFARELDSVFRNESDLTRRLIVYCNGNVAISA